MQIQRDLTMKVGLLCTKRAHHDTLEIEKPLFMNVRQRMGSKCRILTTIFRNTITLVKTHGIFIWIKFFCVNCHISACQQNYYLCSSQRVTKFRNRRVGISATYYLFSSQRFTKFRHRRVGISATYYLFSSKRVTKFRHRCCRHLGNLLFI